MAMNRVSIVLPVAAPKLMDILVGIIGRDHDPHELVAH